MARDDKAAISRANGVGPKLAQRIVTELKGKPIAGAPGLAASVAAPASPAALAVNQTGEAVAALMGLGIGEAIARRSVEAAQARLEPDAGLNVLIKAALQEVGR